MTEYIITYWNIGRKCTKYLGISLVLCLLSGCLGGTVAQQIARTIATSIADKAVANAMAVNEDAESIPRQSLTLQNRPPSELSRAIMTTGFRAASNEQSMLDEPVEKPVLILHASSLVRVQLFNLIIGDEKKAVYENARSIGALNLPNQAEWESWFVASGMREDNKEHITFLIPPKFGKLASGSFAIVELANIGNLNITRYTANERKVYQAMDQSSHSALQ
jgi:hypothetical protein